MLWQGRGFTVLTRRLSLGGGFRSSLERGAELERERCRPELARLERREPTVDEPRRELGGLQRRPAAAMVRTFGEQRGRDPGRSSLVAVLAGVRPRSAAAAGTVALGLAASAEPAVVERRLVAAPRAEPRRPLELGRCGSLRGRSYTRGSGAVRARLELASELELDKPAELPVDGLADELADDLLELAVPCGDRRGDGLLDALDEGSARPNRGPRARFLWWRRPRSAATLRALPKRDEAAMLVLGDLAI